MNLPLAHTYLALKKKNLDGLIVSSEANISYLTGYTCREAYLVISQKKNIYLTDSRYIEEMKKNLPDSFTLKKINGSVFTLIAKTCQGLKLKRVGFEERYLAFGEYQRVKQGLPTGISLISTHSIIEGLREIKTAREIEKIKKAIQITVKALNFIKGFLSVGKREIEVAGELEKFIRYQGASSSAFEIIIASGPNSSYPHHITSQRKLKNHEPVLIDLGVTYKGYKSDLTRVFFLGKITPVIRRVYEIVLEANNRAIQGIRPGVKISKIDYFARHYITQKGYGGFFTHNLGHGIGQEVHEEPHISAREDSLLKPGQIFTIEPAIYLPGKFGIRLEDMVLVTKKGVSNLSGTLHK